MYKRLHQKRIKSPNPNDLKRFGCLTDKIMAKKVITDMNNPKLKCANLIGYFNRLEDIELKYMPQQFVIKWNNWCGDVRIINSHQEYRKKFEHLKRHFNSKKGKVYRNGKAEPHYKFIKQKLLVEEVLPPIDWEYKMHCIWGEPAFIMAINRKQYALHNYTISWEKLNIKRKGKMKNLTAEIPRPDNLDDILEVTRQLAKDYDFIRIDLYSCNGQLYFGEFTFTPSSLMHPYFDPPAFEHALDSFYTSKHVDHNKLKQFT